ncbi:MAG: ABC transporter permease, partial [Rhodospirillaceae bacterium]|nr:ABC transporter permease [Rhodospirillaceae bacterium]
MIGNPKTPANEHYVSRAPFDPYSIETLTPEQERYYLAGQWTLMWWKLRRHKIAVFCAGVLLFMYFCALIAEMLVPYNMESRNTEYIYAPPQAVRLFHDGQFIGPFVYGLKYK